MRSKTRNAFMRPEDQRHHDRGSEQRQGHVAELAPRRGAIDPRGLIEGRIDALQPGQEQQRHEGRLLPGVGQDDRHPRLEVVGQPPLEPLEHEAPDQGGHDRGNGPGDENREPHQRPPAERAVHGERQRTARPPAPGSRSPLRTRRCAPCCPRTGDPGAPRRSCRVPRTAGPATASGGRGGGAIPRSSSPGGTARRAGW